MSSFVVTPRATRVYAAVAFASLATAWTWRTESLIPEGVLLALFSAAAETGRQWLVRQEANELSGEGLDAVVEATRESSVVSPCSLESAASCLTRNILQRAVALHLAAFVALYPLGLHEPYPAYSQAALPGYQVAWPLLVLCSSAVFPLALHLGALDFSSSTTVYSCSNAFILVLVALTGWQNSDTWTFRLVLLILFVANAACQLLPSTVGGIAIDVEASPDGAAYDPLASPASSKPLSLDAPAPARVRVLALLPALLSLLCALSLSLVPSPTLDIVIAHHSHPPSDVAHHIAAVREAPLARMSRVRVYLYEKGEWSDEELWRGLSGAMRRGRDEVVRLPNWGREGGTYLEHIVAHYNASVHSPRGAGAGAGSSSSWLPPALGGGGGGKNKVPRPFADTTLFLQEHMAWFGVAGPRLRRTLSPRTAFVSLGPYQTNLCGHDSEVGTQMGGINDIFAMVKGRECDADKETDRVLSTWAGQFAASRKTLLGNEFAVYERLRRMIEVRILSPSLVLPRSGHKPDAPSRAQAPDDDPIHEQYNPSGPSTQSCVLSLFSLHFSPVHPRLTTLTIRARSNPAFGHALERSWPLLLHCDDPRIAETCRDVAWEPEKCQCFESV